MGAVAYVAGAFVAPESARVALLDRGYLLGDGVFATLRARRGACFRPREHLDVLARGAAGLGLALPRSIDALIELADEAAARAEVEDAYVRVTVTRGAGAPTLSVLARELSPPPPEAYARGVPVVVVGARRVPPACMDGTVKTTSYAPQLIARREADERGAFEGLQLAVDGALACATMGNVFVVSGGELLTPSLASGCRAGVTRGAVLEIARRRGLTAREERLDARVLERADEVFLTNTRIGCLPVATIDGRPVTRDGAFAHARALNDALAEVVARETDARRRAR